MAPHHFENEHLGGGLGPGRDVQSSFPGGHGHVLPHGTKARAAVRKGQQWGILHNGRKPDAATPREG